MSVVHLKSERRWCTSDPPCGTHLGRACDGDGILCTPIPPIANGSSSSSSLFQPTCSNGDHSWPRFESLDELVDGNPRWARYISSVYGELPRASDFPVCAFDFWSISKELFDAAHITTPSPVPMRIQRKWNEQSFSWRDGEFFGRYVEDHPQFYHGFGIYHSDRPYVRSMQWVEVTHHVATNSRGTATERDGRLANMWFSYAPGSGVWYWTGRAALFDSHAHAARELCPNVTGVAWTRSALLDDGYLAVCARRAGYDTIAFRSSRIRVPTDRSCRTLDVELCPQIATSEGSVVSTYGMVGLLEILAPLLSGKYACGYRSRSWSGAARFRAGWRASRPCVCNNSKSVWLNCE